MDEEDTKLPSPAQPEHCCGHEETERLLERRLQSAGERIRELRIKLNGRQQLKRRWWTRLLSYLVVSWQKWRRAVALARYAALSADEKEAAEDAALSRNLLILRGLQGVRGGKATVNYAGRLGVAACRPCEEGPEEQETAFLREIMGMPSVVPEYKEGALPDGFMAPAATKDAAAFGMNVVPLAWKKKSPPEGEKP